MTGGKSGSPGGRPMRWYHHPLLLGILLCGGLVTVAVIAVVVSAAVSLFQ